MEITSDQKLLLIAGGVLATIAGGALWLLGNPMGVPLGILGFIVAVGFAVSFGWNREIPD